MKRKEPSHSSSDAHTYFVIDLQSLSDRTLIAIVLDHSGTNEHDREIFKVLTNRKLTRDKGDHHLWTAKGQRIVEALNTKADTTASTPDNKETVLASREEAARAATRQSKFSNPSDHKLVSCFCSVDNHPASQMGTYAYIQVLEHRHLIKVEGENIVLTDAGKVILETILKEQQEEELKEGPEEK